MLDKIKEDLKKAITEFSIEDFNIYTMNELYMQIANKTNEVIEIVKLLQDYLDEQIFNDVENIELKQQTLENVFNQLIINAGNSNAEIVDARIEADGTTHRKLGDRLNKVDSQIKEKANKNELKVHFIKLNNFGESILVQFDGKNMLVDFGQVYDKETITSYLIKNNVTRLDYIIITHYHSDHIGSLEYILNIMDVTNCKAYLPCKPNFDRFNKNGEQFRQATIGVYNLLNNKNIEKFFPSENQIVDLGEIKLKFNNCNLTYFEDYYNTVSEYATNGETDYNNFSLVTTLIHDDVKVLLPSDINIPAQEKIIDSIGKCNVYKTEHHSTNTLVSESFLNRVNAEISVCCNVDQLSIFGSQTSLHHFKNKKEYYVTYKGDVVVHSNGNRAFVKSNNKRFEGEINTFYNFQSVIDNYNENTELIEIVKTMPSRSKLLTTIDKGNASCPTFVSDYNATIEIYKISPSRANLVIRDLDYKTVKTFDGIWHSANGDKIKWSENINSDVIKYYKSLETLDPTYNENTTLISLVQKMESNSKLEVNLEKSHACCPSFVSDYNATIEIFKVTPNRATLTIKDFDYNKVKIYLGLWHIDNGDTIIWGNVKFENQNELITYKSMSGLYSLGVNDSSDALTILKALPEGSFYSGKVQQSFTSFLSSWGGMATIEKFTASQGRIILSDSNTNLSKTWIGLYHASNGDMIKWSLLNSTMV